MAESGSNEDGHVWLDEGAMGTNEATKRLSSVTGADADAERCCRPGRQDAKIGARRRRQHSHWGGGGGICS